MSVTALGTPPCPSMYGYVKDALSRCGGNTRIGRSAHHWDQKDTPACPCALPRLARSTFEINKMQRGRATRIKSSFGMNNIRDRSCNMSQGGDSAVAEFWRGTTRHPLRKAQLA